MSRGQKPLPWSSGPRLAGRRRILSAVRVAAALLAILGAERWATSIDSPAIALAAGPHQDPIVALSDSFDRADSDRCALGPADLALGGSGGHFYLPIWPEGSLDPNNPVGADIRLGALENNGLDYGGVQLTASPGACSNTAILGEDLGSDLNVRMKLFLPTDDAGHVTQGGPYIRNTGAARGDPIFGSASAGYWIQLESTGEVRVKKLNPRVNDAATGRPAGFDPTVFHTLEIAVRGEALQVALDGKLQTFDQLGILSTTVAIPPTAGVDQGAVGVSFSAEGNRGLIGGQRADDLVVTSHASLSDLPVQSNFGADLAVAITDSPDPAKTRATLTYSVVVTNNGPGPSTGATMTALLPPSVSLSSVSTNDGTCSGTSAVVCVLDGIPAGSRATVAIKVKPTVRGTLQAVVQVTGNEVDPVGANDTASAVTIVQ